MIGLGAISFASPWVLLALASLPAIWLLLRITPPALTRVRFPAVQLMLGLDPTERTPARTPLWLVLLRMFIAVLVVAALAGPVLNAQRLEGRGPVVVVIDNGWGAAAQWNRRVAAARDIIEGADLHRRAVLLVPTAPLPRGEEAPALAPVDARDALARLSQLEPRPWPGDVEALVAAVRGIDVTGADVFWIADGIAQPATAAFGAALERLGAVTVMTAPRGVGPLALSQPRRLATEGGAAHVEIRVKRFATDGDRPAGTVTLRASDASGAVLSEATASFAADAETAVAAFTLPSELANRIARFDVAGQPGAAATALADDRWQRRPVGVYSATAAGTTAPLLEDGFYLTQALGSDAEVRVGNATDLLARPLSILIVSGDQRLSEGETKALSAWVDNGGMLVRFAGPRLDPAADKLLPVKLRTVGRNLGGAMSWGEPAGLGAFPENSPFKRLSVPGDVKVATQMLAEPSADLPDKTWAKLADGTPLITAARRGAGRIVLFHVTATPEWSNLPLSGLFVGMLRELLDLSQGVAAEETAPATLLPPLALLDGLGRTVPPGPTAAPLAFADIERVAAGRDAPPGLYGTSRGKTALNLGPAVWDAALVTAWPANARALSLDALKGERDLKPWLLLAALALLLGDLAISYALRGLAPGPRQARSGAGMAGVLGLVLLLSPTRGDAADTRLDPSFVDAVLKTRLAAVATGSSELDRISQAGLSALTSVLAARTSAELESPASVDISGAIEPEALMPYPLLYWRIGPTQPLPSAQGVAALNGYMRHGGMVVFDAPDQIGAVGAQAGSGAASRLRDVLARIDAPPVVPLEDSHVLTRAFYLMQGLPGRYTGGVVYVERGGGANDGVSTVIIGAHDWAAAWARDARGLPLYPVVPGGEQQREMAYRAGVNMVMYALTGNYKADQVHLPAIMQRLTQ